MASMQDIELTHSWKLEYTYSASEPTFRFKPARGHDAAYFISDDGTEPTAATAGTLLESGKPLLVVNGKSGTKVWLRIYQDPSGPSGSGFKG